MDLISENIILRKFWVNRNLHKLKVNKGTISPHYWSLFPLELIWPLFLSDQTQFCRFQVFNISPGHFIDRSFSLSIFSLIEKFITDPTMCTSTIWFFIKQDQHFLIGSQLLDTFSTSFILVQYLSMKFVVIDSSGPVTVQIWVFHWFYLLYSNKFNLKAKQIQYYSKIHDFEILFLKIHFELRITKQFESKIFWHRIFD